jgi:hypothetical protein
MRQGSLLHTGHHTETVLAKYQEIGGQTHYSKTAQYLLADGQTLYL